jgi:hypothetical protein
MLSFPCCDKLMHNVQLMHNVRRQQENWRMRDWGQTDVNFTASPDDFLAIASSKHNRIWLLYGENMNRRITNLPSHDWDLLFKNPDERSFLFEANGVLFWLDVCSGNLKIKVASALRRSSG